MGPLATADFMKKLTEATPAKRDQDHLPVIAYSVPQIPDRSTSVISGDDAPLNAMKKGIETLVQMGANCIVIPCNTAHYWYDQLQQENGPTILHIADMAATSLKDKQIDHGPIGILATTGTVQTGIYQKRLQKLGYPCMTPDMADQHDLVQKGILAVKRGDIDLGRTLLELATQNLHTKGCQAVVMACTEIPLVLSAQRSPPGLFLLDATCALASGTVKWYFAQQSREIKKETELWK
jgi:aspartate racemase